MALWFLMFLIHNKVKTGAQKGVIEGQNTQNNHQFGNWKLANWKMGYGFFF